MLLKRLTEAIGVSSREDEVRDILREEVGQYASIRTDALGDLIAYKEGTGPKVMLSAHMDEVGLMITGIESNGMLKFRSVGSIDPRVLVAKKVLVGKDKIPGVIGSKPIHLQKPDERTHPIKIEDMCIDIGAKDEAAAKEKVKLGDCAGFATKYEAFQGGLIKGKAFDNRVGCAVIAEVLRHDFTLPVYGAFTVQEEVGGRGAGVVAYDVVPDVTIVLEGTTASDVAGIDPHLHATTVGQGPAITFMDGSVISSRPVVDRLIEVAKKLDIPYQMRRSTASGTDAGKIRLTRTGMSVAVVSVPCRYIHSPVSIASLEDFSRTVALVRGFIESLQEGGLEL
ncbi:MAG: M42 family metallopeptidase [Limnochordia bacterium]|nr:M42 family metallopeptidase [Limnochordia bacterium]